EPPLVRPNLAHRSYGLVDAEVLVVHAHLLHEAAALLLEDDEVLNEIEETLLGASGADDRFERDNPFGPLVIDALPLREMIEVSVWRAYDGVRTVGKHHKTVGPEDLRDRLLVVSEIVLVGIL